MHVGTHPFRAYFFRFASAQICCISTYRPFLPLRLGARQGGCGKAAMGNDPISLLPPRFSCSSVGMYSAARFSTPYPRRYVVYLRIDLPCRFVGTTARAGNVGMILMFHYRPAFLVCTSVRTPSARTFFALDLLGYVVYLRMEFLCRSVWCCGKGEGGMAAERKQRREKEGNGEQRKRNTQWVFLL